VCHDDVNLAFRFPKLASQVSCFVSRNGSGDSKNDGHEERRCFTKQNIVRRIERGKLKLVWRGAALSVGRSVSLLAGGSRERSITRSFYPAPILFSRRFTRHAEVQHAGSFPGAAGCKLTELPTYKAAPLQGVGLFYIRHLFADLLQFGFGVNHQLRDFGVIGFCTQGVEFPADFLAEKFERSADSVFGFGGT
jgi:hypothetical protein